MNSHSCLKKKKSLKHKARICSHGAALYLINLLKRQFFVSLQFQVRFTLTTWREALSEIMGVASLNLPVERAGEQLACTLFRA